MLDTKVQATQSMMKAIALDRFGGLETLKLQMTPVPEVGPNEVLIHVEWAGVGQWDPFEREGGFYAEYAAVKADNVSRIPGNLASQQAGAMPADAMTALRGLDDALALKPHRVGHDLRCQRRHRPPRRAACQEHGRPCVRDRFG